MHTESGKPIIEHQQDAALSLTLLAVRFPLQYSVGEHGPWYDVVRQLTAEEIMKGANWSESLKDEEY